MTARRHLVDLLSFDNDAITDRTGKVLVALRSFYSRESSAVVKRKLASFLPDIVHVHNFMPTLSPSVFFAAKGAHIPIVLTLHVVGRGWRALLIS